MKSKMVLTALIATTALAIYVAAQSKTPTKIIEMNFHRFQKVELRVVAPAGESQAKASGVRYEPLPSWAEKLRIEMLGGTTQEIDLKNVLKMTVSDR